MTVDLLQRTATDTEARLSEAEVAAVRALLDRQAILDVVNDYYHALDSRDVSLLDRVFTDDARYEAWLVDGTRFVCEGRDAIVAACGESRWRTSHHGSRNHRIRISGRCADVDIFAMEAAIDDRRQPGDLAVGPRLYQQGLRYLDTFVKQSDGWRISHRRLYCLWQQLTFNPPVLADLP